MHINNAGQTQSRSIAALLANVLAKKRLYAYKKLAENGTEKFLVSFDDLWNETDESILNSYVEFIEFQTKYTDPKPSTEKDESHG